jgi:fructose-1,6-bisphosphatase
VRNLNQRADIINACSQAMCARPQTPIERLKPGEVVIFDEDEVQYLAQMQENAINNVLHWREARLKELIRMCNVSVSKYLRQIGA